MRNRRCFLCGKEGGIYTEIDFGKVKILCYLCGDEKEGYEERILAKIQRERKQEEVKNELPKEWIKKHIHSHRVNGKEV